MSRRSVWKLSFDSKRNKRLDESKSFIIYKNLTFLEFTISFFASSAYGGITTTGVNPITNKSFDFSMANLSFFKLGQGYTQFGAAFKVLKILAG